MPPPPKGNTPSDEIGFGENHSGAKITQVPNSSTSLQKIASITWGSIHSAGVRARIAAWCHMALRALGGQQILCGGSICIGPLERDVV